MTPWRSSSKKWSVKLRRGQGREGTWRARPADPGTKEHAGWPNLDDIRKEILDTVKTLKRRRVPGRSDVHWAHQVQLLTVTFRESLDRGRTSRERSVHPGTKELQVNPIWMISAKKSWIQWKRWQREGSQDPVMLTEITKSSFSQLHSLEEWEEEVHRSRDQLIQESRNPQNDPI